MKVKNIVFSGVMAAILGATSANAAAISVASQGYVDSKVKANADAIALKADASTVTELDAAYKLADQGLQSAIDGKVAKADYDVKIKALEDADATFATEAYVGTIPEGATATNVVAYVQEKTAGIATEGAMTELDGRVEQVENSLKEGGDTANAIAAALKAGEDAQAAADAAQADADTNAAAILAINNAENGILAQAKADAESKANAAEAAAKQYADGLAGNYAAKTIEATVSSQGEKITALEGQFGETGTTTVAIAAAQDAADAAQEDADKNAEDIAKINNETTGILANAKSYTDTQDAATLASAKTYAEGQASAAQAAAEATAAGALEAAMANIAAAYLEKPAECATTYCVLSVTGKGENESITWMPLTEPQSEYYPAE